MADDVVFTILEDNPTFTVDMGGDEVFTTNEVGVPGDDAPRVHGELEELDADDHPQYHTDGRGDARYYTQSQSDVALAGKANTSHTHPTSDIVGLTTLLDAKAALVHTHTQAEVIGLVTDLAGKAPTIHGHAQSAITGLVAALAGKAASVHTHDPSDVTGLVDALALKADLVGGFVQTSQIPAIAITSCIGKNITSEAAMLLLVGQEGDWCIRTDLGSNWVITGPDPSSLADWTEMIHPDSPVTSVNGQIGPVTLGPSDVGAQAATGELTATVTTNTPSSLVGVVVATGGTLDALNSTTNGYVFRVAGGVMGWGTLDATSIGGGAVSNTAFGYLAGVTSAIQIQFNTLTADVATKADAAATTSALALKAASVHSHAQSDITDLVTDLAAKASTSALTSGLATKANTSHSHAQSDITDLVTDLAGKAPTAHSHAQSDITGLAATLAALAAQPVWVLCSADFAWSTTLIDQPWSTITFPSTGIYEVTLLLITGTSVSQTLTPRFVMDTAVIAGVTGTPVGSGGITVTAASITTGSPTVISLSGGAGTSIGRIFTLCLDVTTAGAMHLQIAHNNGAGGLKTCKGSFIKLVKIA